MNLNRCKQTYRCKCKDTNSDKHGSNTTSSKQYFRKKSCTLTFITSPLFTPSNILMCLVRRAI